MRAMCAGCALTVMAGILLLAASANAAEDAALAFYRGKQVRFFTMGSQGGGYDAYTRLVSAFLGRKLAVTWQTASNRTSALKRFG